LAGDNRIAPTDLTAPWNRPRWWTWRAFRGRSDPSDGSDGDCRRCEESDHALRYYCIKLAHYEFQRDWNRGLFRFWQIVAIVATAAVPVLAAAGVAQRWVDALFAAVAAVSLASIGLFGWRNDYVHFTRVVEQLLAERVRFNENVGSYQTTEDKNSLFARRITEVVGAEIEGWRPPEPEPAAGSR
jgi:Protein of unknown function (DUF4231)